MTNELIAGVIGIVLSLAFDFAPYLKDWYGKLQPGQKRLAATGLGFGVVAVVFGLSCANLFSISEFTCDQAGIEEALTVWVAYVFTN
ncbi:hypothetical protein KA005_58440, partial [bacterium]|nr:hypothetical protein [bacterium]